jgi:hypothetical protein
MKQYDYGSAPRQEQAYQTVIPRRERYETEVTINAGNRGAMTEGHSQFREES